MTLFYENYVALHIKSGYLPLTLVTLLFSIVSWEPQHVIMDNWFFDLWISVKLLISVFNRSLITATDIMVVLPHLAIYVQISHDDKIIWQNQIYSLHIGHPQLTSYKEITQAAIMSKSLTTDQQFMMTETRFLDKHFFSQGQIFFSYNIFSPYW